MIMESKNILIAYMPSWEDLEIAFRKNWYRIPVSTKIVPQIVKERNVGLIAFYLPKVFRDEAYQVKYYGHVTSVKIYKRKYLLKDEPLNPKSENQYYKIKFSKLLRLVNPIKSIRKRRILFIVTSLNKFECAKEINDLFIESPLEEKLWKEFKRIGIRAERQYLETIKSRNFYLDFALFCKSRKLAIECDGDRYHMGKEFVQMDKRRDNLLESRGWNVLRYTSNDIQHHLNHSVTLIKEAINHYGGLVRNDESEYGFFPTKSEEPTLFD